MMAAERADIFTGPEQGRVICRSLDSLYAIFDRASGMTHVMVSPMPEILAAVTNWSGTTAELLGKLQDQFELEGDGDVNASAEQLAARIGELVDLGLVRRR